MKINADEQHASVIENTIIITGTWNPSITNNNVRAVVRGEVTLNGKTDCYSLTFEEGGHLTINAGARLRIWQGGITNNDCVTVNYLTIDFGYSIAGIGGEPPQLLIHPNVTVNNTPKATIRVGQYHVGDAGSEQYWQRWGCLTDQITSWTKEGPEMSYPTYLYVWDYENDDWKNGTINDIKKFNGISASPTNNYPADFTIIYEGNLLSNQNYEIQSNSEGWNYLVNSYPGKINLTKFMEQSPMLDRLGIILREPNTPSKEVDFKHNTYYIYPGQCFMPRAAQQIGAFVFNYKNMVWDPSFEE